MTARPDPVRRDELQSRVAALKLYGLMAHWDDLPESELPQIQRLVEWEEIDEHLSVGSFMHGAPAPRPKSKV